jgi:WD40 repeat protein/serine/threonine protein kinase
MPDTTISEQPPKREGGLQQLVSLLMADQRERWPRGDVILFERYLADMVLVQSDLDSILDLICNEVVLRTRRGDSPSYEEYLQRCADYVGRFPDFANQLRCLFEVEGAIEAAADPLASTEPYATLPSTNTRQQPAASLATSALRIGSYEVLGELGRGAMGVVYKVRQIGLNRIAALKMILAGPHAAAEELFRFRLEAEAVARLQHPNIVQIYEIAEQDGRPYFSLEFVDGGSLARKLGGTPQPARQAAELLETLARTVAYAHERGIIHRDLKPANVLLTADGKPKISDFGLAKRLDPALESSSSQNGERGQIQSSSHTRTGDIMGTPSYMAPEQASGKIHLIGPASDVYALGAILYEMITGRPPFRGATSVETLQQVVFNDLVPPSRLQPRVPRDLETICLKCLQKEITKRYVGAQELADDLRRFLAGEAILARRTSSWERTIKWAKRRPGIAVLSSALFVAITTGTPLVMWNWQVAVKEADRATKAEGVALLAENVALRRLYASRMNEAFTAWQKAEVDQVSRLLAEQIPVIAASRATSDLRGFEWYFLDRLCHNALVTFPSGECGVAFSPDGQFIASGNDERSVTIRKADTGKEVRALRGFNGIPTCVAFSPDSKRLATGGEDRAVSVWDVRTGEQRLSLRGHRGPIKCVCFSPDGRQIASAGEDRTVRVWDVATGKPMWTFLGHSQIVYCVAFSPDGKSIASGGIDQNLFVWDTSGKVLHEYPRRHSRCVAAVAFGPDGKSLASGGYDNLVKLSDLNDTKKEAVFHGHVKEVTSIAFSADGKHIVSGSLDHTVRIWETQTSQETRAFRGHLLDVRSVAYHPDGKRVASAGLDRTARIWDATSDQESHTLAGHTALASSVAFSPDGVHLASSGLDGTVRIWDARSSKSRILRGHKGPINNLTYSLDGQSIASAGEDGSVRVWKALDGEPTESLPLVLSSVDGPVTDVAFSMDGRYVASANKTLKIWDLVNGKLVRRLAAHVPRVTSVAFSPDGRHVASAGDDMSVKIWDVANLLRGSGEVERPPIATLIGHEDGITSIAYSADGKYLASASGDKSAIIWDPANAQKLFGLTGHARAVQDIAFSPDGERLATVSLDRSVRLWDTHIGQETLILGVPPGTQATSVAFSPDGEHLAVAGGRFTRGEIRIWDAPRQ